MSTDAPRPDDTPERPAVDDPFGPATPGPETDTGSDAAPGTESRDPEVLSASGDENDDTDDDEVTMNVLAAMDDLIGRYGSAEDALTGLMADSEIRGIIDEAGLSGLVGEYMPGGEGDGPSIPPVVDVAFLDDHPDARLVDSRFYLDGRDAEAEYRTGHLPGAVFVDVDTDLSGRPAHGVGRHPLPDPESFAAAMSRVGIDAFSTVVVYDDAHGFGAGRLTWMLRTLGVDAALLDGGLEQWGGELETGDVAVEPADFPVVPWPDGALADLGEMRERAETDEEGVVVLDARAGSRYAGEGETIDPVGGHVPGAVSAPFSGNLDEHGRFLEPDELRQRFAGLGIDDEDDVIVYCGSGISAAHDLLALERAGIDARLFPGSWSQWATTPGLPIATGETPRGEVTQQ